MQDQPWNRVATALLLCLSFAAACDGGGPRQGGGGGGMAATPAGDNAAMRTRPEPREASPSRGAALPMAAERPRGGTPTTSGPTGLSECDQALKVVCRCAKEQPSLRRPCHTLEEDAPGWKGRAKEADPGQIEDLRRACGRILASVQEAYGCK